MKSRRYSSMQKDSSSGRRNANADASKAYKTDCDDDDGNYFGHYGEDQVRKVQTAPTLEGSEYNDTEYMEGQDPPGNISSSSIAPPVQEPNQLAARRPSTMLEKRDASSPSSRELKILAKQQAAAAPSSSRATDTADKDIVVKGHRRRSSKGLGLSNHSNHNHSEEAAEGPTVSAPPPDVVPAPPGVLTNTINATKRRPSDHQAKFRSTYLNTGMKPGAYPDRGPVESTTAHCSPLAYRGTNSSSHRRLPPRSPYEPDEENQRQQQFRHNDVSPDFSATPSNDYNNGQGLIEAVLVSDEQTVYSAKPNTIEPLAIMTGEIEPKGKHFAERDEKPGVAELLLKHGKLQLCIACLVCFCVLIAVVVVIVVMTMVVNTNNSGSASIVGSNSGVGNSPSPSVLPPELTNPPTSSPVRNDPATDSPVNTSTGTAITGAPTATPSAVPTVAPTSEAPSAAPSTPAPTTAAPTVTPGVPTRTPSAVPTGFPTTSPSSTPSANPTTNPTKKPTLPPTGEPVILSTLPPTPPPTSEPIFLSTPRPTRPPTSTPLTLSTPRPTAATVAPGPYWLTQTLTVQYVVNSSTQPSASDYAALDKALADWLRPLYQAAFGNAFVQMVVVQTSHTQLINNGDQQIFQANLNFNQDVTMKQVVNVLSSASIRTYLQEVKKLGSPFSSTTQVSYNVTMDTGMA